MKPQKQPHIIVVLKTTDPTVDFWHSVMEGVSSAAKEFDVKVDIRGVERENDITGQIRILRQAAAEKPDAIVLAASDYNLCVPEAQKIVQSGIKLVTVDSGINSTLPSSFISTDNVEAGRIEGQMLSSMVKDDAKIAIINFVKDSSTAIDREKGFKQGLKPQQLQNLAGTYYCNSSVKEAYEITKNLLTQHPDIQGIAGFNEWATNGAAKAVTELGMAQQIKLIGFDSSLTEIQYLEQDIVRAVVVQEPFSMGYLALKTTCQVIRHEPVSRRVNIESHLVTKETMYSIKNEKLLFPFENGY